MINIGTGTCLCEREDRQKKYRLDQHLYTGEYSHVYVARQADEPAASGEVAVVAKVGRINEEHEEGEAFEQRIADLQKRYDRENDVISNLQKHSGGRFVPWARWGSWEDSHLNHRDQRVPVLLLRRMGNDTNDWSLARAIREERDKDNWLKAETLAVKSGAQYAEMLSLLHRQLKLTCSDRKAGDMRWDPDHESLYVLDWNVVSELPSSRPREELIALNAHHNDNAQQMEQLDAAEIQRDVRLFGRLWFLMLIGREVEKAGALRVDKPELGTDWAKLSQGMRRRLGATLGSGSEGGFRNAEEACEAWQTYADWLESNDDSLYKLASNLKDSPGIADWQQRWDVIRDILDLLRLKEA